MTLRAPTRLSTALQSGKTKAEGRRALANLPQSTILQHDARRVCSAVGSMAGGRVKRTGHAHDIFFFAAIRRRTILRRVRTGRTPVRRLRGLFGRRRQQHLIEDLLAQEGHRQIKLARNRCRGLPFSPPVAASPSRDLPRETESSPRRRDRRESPVACGGPSSSLCACG
jgi:hypothetical protein